MYWFPCVEVIVAVFLIWLMPKRVTSQEMYVMWLVMIALTHTFDLFLAVELKLYHLGTPKPDWQATLIEMLLPPACGVIVMNFMPIRRTAFIMYLIGVVLLSDCTELLNVHFRYVNYVHWNIWYSSIVYILGVLYIRWHSHFIRSQRK
ncbi:hypothetical protein [Alicyclobacillus fastidiosus]|uniref:Uncharacterized protein n=1 Tax=Alicyclobacillus fastidiosus TaxID=392011 RepID=A0ABV5AKL0_9BACL|nr:hypothetical protein [Alicyclobacillus fastidiosus]WEH08328.1 hypothetical protein PYS47_16710 [Alicyclobacillus fastidiosus]